MNTKSTMKNTTYLEAWGVHLSGKGTLTQEERESLLSRLHRTLVFIGYEIPLKVELEGEPVPLHELMWKLMTHEGALTPEEFVAVDALHHEIELKIREEELELKSADITKDEARELFVEASGLIRAAVAIRDIEKRGELRDYSEVAASAKVDAEKRWVEYLQKIR